MNEERLSSTDLVNFNSKANSQKNLAIFHTLYRTRCYKPQLKPELIIKYIKLN